MRASIGRRPLLLAVLAISTAAACKGGAGGSKGAAGSASGKRAGGGKGEGGPSFPVEVYAVEKRKVEYFVTAPGSVDAFERVQVTARVAGGVDKVSFVEGQAVKKGDVLVVIDSSRYQVAVSAAAAAVEKAKAMQADSEMMVKRRESATAAHPGLIPGEEIGTLKTKVLTAKADYELAVQELRSAQLNLRDSSVKAPMDGIIQTRTVETGQYVQAGYVMATLLRDEPMLLRFQVSPVEAPRVKTGMIAEFKVRETLRVFKAKITLVSASADAETRMVPVTAEVEKTDNDYWLRPGSFCDVTINAGGMREVIVIPRAAVRPTENGFVAYVIDKDKDVAHERVLQLGMNTEDGWVEVRDGLVSGDRLVLRGTEPLAEGAKVKVKDVEAPVSSGFTPKAAAPGSAAMPPGSVLAPPASSGAPK